MSVLTDFEAEKLQKRLRKMPGWAYRQIETAALEDHMSVFEYVLINDISLDPADWDIDYGNDPNYGLSHSELVEYGYEEAQLASEGKDGI